MNSNAPWGKMTKEQQKNGMGKGFQTFASRASCWTGSRWSFLGALLIIIVWAVLGPYFHYSDTWQLVVNTATTIITFLMVFLIQNTQNRDARAIHLKLDEIIRSIQPARNEMIDIEKLSDEELEALSKKFEVIRARVPSKKPGITPLWVRIVSAWD
jgi:low affinity Fe/Cu permease